MPDPEFKFNQEEFTLTISGLGGGWRFRDLSTIRLFDQAEVQFPSSWSQFKVGAAMQIFDAQWRLHSTTLLTQTLEAGIDYTRADGTGGSVSSDTNLVQHLLDRPTVSLDLRLNVRLEGTANRQGFEGSATAGLFLGGRF
jgi:hypothetical protein